MTMRLHIVLCFILTHNVAHVTLINLIKTLVANDVGAAWEPKPHSNQMFINSLLQMDHHNVITPSFQCSMEKSCYDSVFTVLQLCSSAERYEETQWCIVGS